MRQLRWTGPRLVAAALAGVLVGAVVTWLAARSRGADASTAAGGGALPACTELPGTRIGPLEEDPGWNGCVTDGGAAVQSYRFACSGLHTSGASRGERLADEAVVAFLPDAGLMTAEGQPWVESPNARVAFLRTPFAMLVAYRCDELRSLPHDDVIPADCALDDVPLDLHTTQGCTQDGRVYAAAGRMCGYAEFDTTVSWEQWSIDPPDFTGREDAFVLESGPDEQWWMVPAVHRDERCSTAPDEWNPAWS